MNKYRNVFISFFAWLKAKITTNSQHRVPKLHHPMLAPSHLSIMTQGLENYFRKKENICKKQNSTLFETVHML